VPIVRSETVEQARLLPGLSGRLSEGPADARIGRDSWLDMFCAVRAMGPVLSLCVRLVSLGSCHRLNSRFRMLARRLPTCSGLRTRAG